MYTGTSSFQRNPPQDLGFVDRSDPDNFLKLEVDFHVGKKQLKQILESCINTHGTTKTAEVLDDIKALGYKYSTMVRYDGIYFRYDSTAEKADILQQLRNRLIHYKTLQTWFHDRRRTLQSSSTDMVSCR